MASREKKRGLFKGGSSTGGPTNRKRAATKPKGKPASILGTKGSSGKLVPKSSREKPRG